MARVKRPLVGKDGKSRGAVLRVSTGNGQCSTWQRPVQRLYPLEINDEIEENTAGIQENPADELTPMDDESAPMDDESAPMDDESAPMDDLETQSTGPMERPRQRAATNAAGKFKQWSAMILEEDDDAVDG